MFRRYTIQSTIEVPLTVEGADWRAAFRTGLDLLECQSIGRRLQFRRGSGATILARDPVTGAEFSIVEVSALAA